MHSHPFKFPFGARKSPIKVSLTGSVRVPRVWLDIELQKSLRRSYLGIFFLQKISIAGDILLAFFVHFCEFVVFFTFAFAETK